MTAATLGASTGGQHVEREYVTHSLTNTGHDAVERNGVRRLTVTECCRLQGFPDDWFGTPNEPPDSPKYAALGDAVTVNVAEWIGRRIIEAARAEANRKEKA